MARFGLYFCLPKYPFLLHVGRWGRYFCNFLLDGISFWVSLVAVTYMLATFQSLCVKTARTYPLYIQIHECFNINLPMVFSNLHMTKTLLSLSLWANKLKQTRTHEYTGQRRGRRNREALTINCLAQFFLSFSYEHHHLINIFII